jgi:hypothetical protein
MNILNEDTSAVYRKRVTTVESAREKTMLNEKRKQEAISEMNVKSLQPPCTIWTFSSPNRTIAFKDSGRSLEWFFATC